MSGGFAFTPGAVFAQDYQIVRQLSAGGMGIVYVAHQLSTGRERALKVMLGDLASNEDLRRRFEQEARVGAQIESEHVVEVVGAGIDAASGAPWLAMELLQGEDLASYLSKSGPMPPALFLEIFEQLCHAVGAAHRKQIVHRDLKPENLFLAQTRRAGASFMVKVLDFGIAKLLNQVRTSSTAAMGTPLWMAPEQTQSKSRISPAADVWAMGLIAFRALTGRPYWKSAGDADSSAMMILREVVMEPIVPSSARAHELSAAPVPPGFDAWFAGCVERDPMRRFPDADVALAELKRALGGSAPALTGAVSQQAPGLTHYAPPPVSHGQAATSAARPTYTAPTPPPVVGYASVPLAPPPKKSSRLPLWIGLGVALCGVAAIAGLVSRGAKGGSKSTSGRSDANEERSRAPRLFEEANPGHVEMLIDVQGNVPVEEVRTAAMDASGAFSCYRYALNENAKLRARVIVPFTIKADGKVEPSGDDAAGATAEDIDGGAYNTEAFIGGCASAPTRMQVRYPKPSSGDAKVKVTWLFGYHQEGATVVSDPIDMTRPMAQPMSVAALAAGAATSPEKYEGSMLRVVGRAGKVEPGAMMVGVLGADPDVYAFCATGDKLPPWLAEGAPIIVTGRSSLMRSSKNRVLIGDCKIERAAESDVPPAAAPAPAPAEAPSSSSSPSSAVPPPPPAPPPPPPRVTAPPPAPPPPPPPARDPSRPCGCAKADMDCAIKCSMKKKKD